jgi:hypothetical protein
LIKIKIRMTKEMQLISMYSNVSIKISPYVKLCQEYSRIGHIFGVSQSIYPGAFDGYVIL